MPKIEVTSDAPAIAADRRYLPNVTNNMWSAVTEASARSLPPPGPAADFRQAQGRLAHRLGALAQVVQMLLDPEQVRVRKLLGRGQHAARVVTLGYADRQRLSGHGRRHHHRPGDLGRLARSRTAHFPRHRVAAWAPLVETAANEGDAVAAEILRGAAQSLALFASAVRRQLFPAGAQAAISYAGGVFQSERVLETFRTLVELDDSIKVTPPRYSPAAGALIGAYRLATKSVDLQGAPPIK